MDWYIVIFIIAAAAAVLMLAGGTSMFFNFAILSDNFKKEKRTNAWDEDENDPDEVYIYSKCLPYKDELLEGRKWVKSQPLADFSVTSYDGLTLRAKYVPANGKEKGIVLMMHGFRSSALHDFSLAIKIFHEMGYGCMLPYHRAHGDSEGKYITYGTKERFDVLSWCRLIEEKFPGVPVILDGISMGGATVLMASGLELPGNVKGIIADCAFTSPYEVFKHVMRRNFKMGPFPFLHTTRLYAKIRAGLVMKSVSTPDALKKNRLPLLIVHGEADDLVPYSMSERNFEVAKENCDATFLSVPGAAHGISFLVDRERYTAEVKKLLDKCINKEEA
ncbi:MAG: alpha/beta hydrolase [Clostridia bacterium]|nr:alpha/beta hydrolase [Clostridia bacterium]